MPKRKIKVTKVDNNVCCICGKDIKVQIFKNSGVCSELCRKDRDNDHDVARAINP